jgi:hypothetical protein
VDGNLHAFMFGLFGAGIWTATILISAKLGRIADTLDEIRDRLDEVHEAEREEVPWDV